MDEPSPKRRRLLSDKIVKSNDQIAPMEPQNVPEPAEINKPNTSDGSQQTDQPILNASDTVEPMLVPTCRLRHGLNDDCLCEIFKYLDVHSLIQLCKLDVYYKNLILQSIIGKKLIEFKPLQKCWTMYKIFREFGKSMRKIKIEVQKDTRFINWIIRHCSGG